MLSMSYDYRDKKTVIVISSTVPIGIAGNIIAHLSLAIGHNVDSTDMGRSPLLDGSGKSHIGISKYPVIVTKVKPGRVTKLLAAARANATRLLIVDYPEEMLHTGHDDELSAALLKKQEHELNYLGVALHGSAEVITALTGKFTLWGNGNT